MKSLKLQIEFVDKKLLRLFGFKNIIDYSHIICVSDPDTIPIDLDKLNGLIEEFRKIFHAKNFSLHKTQYKIITKSQAVCLLKTCLEITSIPYDLSTKKHKRYLRLLSKNNILEDYINTLKMTENRTFTQKNIFQINSQVDSSNSKTGDDSFEFTTPNPEIKSIQTDVVNSNIENPQIDIKADPPKPKAVVSPWYNSMFEPDVIGHKETEKIQIITKEELNANIKKVSKYEFYLLPKKILLEKNSLTNEVYLSIDLKNTDLRNKILKSCCVSFVSKTLDGSNIISDDFIKQLSNDLIYEMTIGGSINWTDKFTNGQNCLIDDVIIPLVNLQHHTCCINIKNISKITDILNILELKISVECVELYQELENKMARSLIEQVICLNERYNKFRILLGMAGNAYGDFSHKEKFEKFKSVKMLDYASGIALDKCELKNPTNDIIKEADFFDGHSINLEISKSSHNLHYLQKLTGFEIINKTDKFVNGDVDKVFKYDGYEFVKWSFVLTKSIERLNYRRYLENNNIFAHKYDIYFEEYQPKSCKNNLPILIENLEIFVGNSLTHKDTTGFMINYIIDYDCISKKYYPTTLKQNNNNTQTIFLQLPQPSYTLSNQSIKFNFNSKYLLKSEELLGINIVILSTSLSEPLINDVIMSIKAYKFNNIYDFKVNKFQSRLYDVGEFISLL